MSERTITPSTDRSAELALLVERLSARLEAGEPVDVDQIARDHPEYATELRDLLPAVALMVNLSRSGERRGVSPTCGTESPTCASDGGAPLGELGDFRLIREVGRGGMGIVYEAEQISLNRRVALKVLPYAATMDPKQLQRFKNESRAAASLRHEHIVHVYGVGCERGVHYYAMEFIDGLTLAQIIAAMPEGEKKATAPDGTAAYTPTSSVAGLCEAGPRVPAGHANPGSQTPATEEIAALSTQFSGPKNREFYRNVARLIADAADALEHAHSLGIVHRDVKPGNLMLDAAGKVYVTDFGLARLGPDAGLTMSGDLLGTLRYMAPEQVLSHHGLIDHRADVYGLGCTLYEVLTGRPAVYATGRAEILRRIAFEDPTAPRRLHRAIPAELETVTLKCLSKNPNERFATAGELAADLRRWLGHQPIWAKRPSLALRARRWARRHRALVGAAAAGLLLAAAVLGGSVTWIVREAADRRQRLEPVVTAALGDAERLQEEGRWPEALDAAKRAQGLLAGGAVGTDLRRRVEEARDGLALVARLEEVRLEFADSASDRSFDREWKDGEYARAFREAGIDVDELGPEGTAARIPAAVRVPVAAALDDWAAARQQVEGRDGRTWQPLVAAARAADPDEWRGRLRDAVARKNRRALTDLATEARADDLPAASLVRLGSALGAVGANPEAIAVLRRAHRRYPGDFWVNFELAFCQQGFQQDEAVRFYTAALALRPRSMGVHNNLGNALKAKDDVDGAMTAYLEAIRLKPEATLPQDNLHITLKQWTGLNGLIAAQMAATRLKPDDISAHLVLGIALRAKGDRDGAVAAFREASRLQPGNAAAHTNVGQCLQDKEDWDGAVAAHREAARLRPSAAVRLRNLGDFLRDTKKDLERAITVHREAIRRKPDEPWSHLQLAYDLHAKGDQIGADATFREGLRLDPTIAPRAYDGLLGIFRQHKQLDGASVLREVIRVNPKDAEAHAALSKLLMDRGDVDGAVVALREVIRLEPDHVETCLVLAQNLKNSGNLDAAIAMARETIHRKPDSAKAHATLGDILRRGRGQQLDPAIDAYREALRHDPTLAQARNGLLTTLRHKEDWLGAVAFAREEIRKNPNDPDMHTSLSETLRAKGDLDGAIAAVRDGIRLIPHEGEGYSKLGGAYHKLAVVLRAKRDAEGAVDAWRKALMHYDNHVRNRPSATSYTRMAEILATCEDERIADPRRAVELFRKAAETRTRSTGYWRIVAVAQYRLSDWREAIAAAEKADSPNNVNPVHILVLALAHARRGELDQARSWYAKLARATGQRPDQEQYITRLWAETAQLLGPPPKPKDAQPPPDSD